MSYYVTIHEMNINVPKSKVKKILAEIDEALQNHGWSETGIRNVLATIGFEFKPDMDLSWEQVDDEHAKPVYTPSKVRMTLVPNENWDGRWTDEVEKALEIIARYAFDDSYIYMMGEDNELFGYQIYDHKLLDMIGEITWKIAPWCKEEG